jgi:hypothetical protein
MRRRLATAARARPVIPVRPTAGGAASYSAVQLRRGPRTADGPGWAGGRRRLAEYAAQCRLCGVADGVSQVGPSGTARGSSELVKAHTPRRSRPSCRNIGQLRLLQDIDSGAGRSGIALRVRLGSRADSAPAGVGLAPDDPVCLDHSAPVCLDQSASDTW